MLSRDGSAPDVGQLCFLLADAFHQDPDVFLSKPLGTILDLVEGTVTMREKKAARGRTS